MQRKFKRVRYQLPVGCLGCYEVFSGRTSDLSEDGAGLELGRPVDPGMVLSLIFRLPTRTRPVVVCVRVRWQRQDEESVRCGLQYLWLAPDDRVEIQQFLNFLKGENEPESAVLALLGAGHEKHGLDN